MKSAPPLSSTYHVLAEAVPTKHKSKITVPITNIPYLSPIFHHPSFIIPFDFVEAFGIYKVLGCVANFDRWIIWK
jgi:hypothetical protein